MKKIKHIILTIIVVAAAMSASAKLPPPVDVQTQTTDWMEYAIIDGVKIEYRIKECEVYGRQQNLLLFRYTNLNSTAVTCSWNTLIYRDGHCYNCHRADSPEHAHTLVLNGNETVEGDGTTGTDDVRAIFGNFIHLVPGMTETYLTGFELTNFAVNE